MLTRLFRNKDYEIATSFAWHQGWNDGLSHVTVAEYETNLTNLIKDLRKEWNTPNLPVAIAVSGFGGWSQKIDRRGIIKAQHAVAKLKEFKGTVASVETRLFPPSRGLPRRARVSLGLLVMLKPTIGLVKD